MDLTALHRRSTRRRRLLAVCAAAALLVACGDDGDTRPARPHQGGVTIVDGANKGQLELAEGSPQLVLTSQFFLGLTGQLDGTVYRITLLIEPTSAPRSYSFPADAQLLVATLARDGVSVALGAPQGTLSVERQDDESGFGRAVVDVTLQDSSNFALAEIGLVFPGGGG